MRFCRPIAFSSVECRTESVEFATAHQESADTRAVANSPLSTLHSPLKTRDRWPFLDEPDCPVELHALVGRRISMYHEYSKLYPQLRGAESLTELSTLCGKLLDAYLDNQACTRELEYYAKHRRVLGRHPLLKHFTQLYRLRSKTTKQLFEERKRTTDNIWRAESEIRKGDKPHLDGERRKRIEQYRLKLQEINNLLGEQ